MDIFRTDALDPLSNYDRAANQAGHALIGVFLGSLLMLLGVPLWLCWGAAGLAYFGAWEVRQLLTGPDERKSRQWWDAATDSVNVAAGAPFVGLIEWGLSGWGIGVALVGLTIGATLLIWR